MALCEQAATEAEPNTLDYLLSNKEAQKGRMHGHGQNAATPVSDSQNAATPASDTNPSWIRL